MKNNQSGFTSILLVLFVLIFVVGGVYFYSKQKSEVKVEDLTLTTDVQGAATVASTSEVKGVSKNSLPDSEFLKVVPEGKILAKGDINMDGYEDAIIQIINCGSSCSSSLEVVLNDKNITAKVLKDKNYPDTFSPAFLSSSAIKSSVDKISIKDGIISLTGKGLDCGVDCDERKWNVVKTVTYKFNGKSIIQLSVIQQPQPESFKKQPVKILSIKDLENNTWSIQADVLTYNSDWTPGGGGSLYLNQNSKIRNLIISKNTKVNICNREGILSSSTTNSLVSDITKILKSGSEFIVSMDIEGDKVITTYEKCSS